MDQAHLCLKLVGQDLLQTLLQAQAFPLHNPNKVDTEATRAIFSKDTDFTVTKPEVNTVLLEELVDTKQLAKVIKAANMKATKALVVEATTAQANSSSNSAVAGEVTTDTNCTISSTCPWFP